MNENSKLLRTLLLKKRFNVLAILCVCVFVFIILLYAKSYAKNLPKDNFIKRIYSPLQNSMPPLLNQNKYILSPNNCSSTDPLLAIILVTSYYGNVETRSAMRRAFSNFELTQMNLRRVFLLGVAENDKYTNQGMIESEHERFGDLIQGNFTENYRNLTYKHLMGLKWATKNCAGAKYVIKIDDDIVVNMVQVRYTLLDNVLHNKGNFIAGYLMKNMKPVREPHSKWYVTKEEYDFESYPLFVSGWFYITNPKTVQNLLQASEQIPYFWIDDLYITGILAQVNEVQFKDLGNYFTTDSEKLRCCIEDYEQYKYNCDVVVGPNGGDNNLFYEFNNLLKECTSEKKCKKKVLTPENDCSFLKRKNYVSGQPEIEKYRLF